jgi:hypothetical protein
MSFNAETIAKAIPSYREQVGAIDCSFIPKSGKTTWGVDSFYNGSSGKSEKGLEISVILIVDMDACQGYTLSVQQTPFTERTPLEPAKPKLRKSETLASLKVTLQNFRGIGSLELDFPIDQNIIALVGNNGVGKS